MLQHLDYAAQLEHLQQQFDRSFLPPTLSSTIEKTLFCSHYVYKSCQISPQLLEFLQQQETQGSANVAEFAKEQSILPCMAAMDAGQIDALVQQYI
ncbi:MAG: hypothetical protein HRU21_08530, partial [Pseudomonadales bacterium]|nr:hypothetical protein [Pseudomonadales bacterium]